MAEQKDTIYIDIDDEITAIIDKIDASTAKIVALVLPKRAVALQSIVNMKLLKRTADDSGKHIVLITSEKALLPLIGATGLYAAKTLQSKPEIPAAPSSITALSDEESVTLDDDSPEAKAGELAVEDTVELADSKAAAAKPSKTKKAGKKSPKVPNFEKFRLKLFLIIGGVIALIALWYVAVFVMPSATVVIDAETESVNSSVEFTANPNITELNLQTKTVPAEVARSDEKETQKAPTTGQKDVGDQATGSVTMSAQQCDSIATPASVPAGTTLSANGLNFTTNESVSFAFQDISGGCINFSGGTTGVKAQKPGANYNLSNTTFAVAGRGEVSAQGSTNGGSSKIAKVVAQQDVDTAKGKMTASDDAIKTKLKAQLEQQGLFAIEASFEKHNEETSTNPKVGQEASEVSVTYSATYSMVGVKRDDLKALLTDDIKDQIDSERQQIQDDGLDQATFTVKSSKADGTTVLSVSTIVAVGPNIDVEQLKQNIAGQKSGEAENTVRALPGVKDVVVDLNPFWVNKVPKKTDKITIEFKQAE